jgi:hypothetical protein
MPLELAAAQIANWRKLSTTVSAGLRARMRVVRFSAHMPNQSAAVGFALAAALVSAPPNTPNGFSERGAS